MNAFARQKRWLFILTDFLYVRVGRLRPTKAIISRIYILLTFISPVGPTIYRWKALQVYRRCNDVGDRPRWSGRSSLCLPPSHKRRPFLERQLLAPQRCLSYLELSRPEMPTCCGASDGSVPMETTLHFLEGRFCRSVAELH